MATVDMTHQTARPDGQPPWHVLDRHAVLIALGTCESGLLDTEARLG